MLTDVEPKVKRRSHMICNFLPTVLANAVEDIDEHLDNPIYRRDYPRDVLTRILLVRHAMDDLRQELAELPAESEVVDTILRTYGYDPDEVSARMQAAATRAMEKVRHELDEMPDTQTPPAR
jgi:hypothetical protein